MQLKQWPLALSLGGALVVAVLLAREPADDQPGASRTAPTAPAASGVQVLANVNGHPITAADVALKAKADSHGGSVTAERKRSVLESLVNQELMFQRALELGYDADPKFQEELREVEAQVTAFKRRRLGDLFVEREIVGKVDVTEPQARKFFDEHAVQVRTELHLLQILRRTRAAIDAAQAQLGSGKSFEEIARAGFDEAPAGKRGHWDLGPVKWIQLPAPIRDAAFALKPGEVSGVLVGPNDRYWIVKLVDRHEDPSLTYEAVKQPLLDSLRQAKVDARRAQVEREIRERAKIVYPGQGG
jgi:parvulin-like peptidyl-prolyl isomerase